MEIECPRHPGASTIGSQLQDETPPLAGNNPAMSPHAEGTKGTHYNDIVYTVEKREGEGGGGNNPETTLKIRMVLQKT